MATTQWALIVDGRVYELTDIDPTDRFAPDLVWVKCGASVGQGFKYDGSTFTDPNVLSLDDVKAAKVADLRASCEQAIIGGYVSSALGAPHTYPSLPTDQINMLGSVTDSL